MGVQERLAELLREAEAAHAEHALKETLVGRAEVPNSWPEFYATFLLDHGVWIDDGSVEAADFDERAAAAA